LGEFAEGRAFAGQAHFAGLEAGFARLICRLELVTFAAHNQNQSGDLFSLAMEGQLETVRQQSLQHLPKFGFRSRACRLGEDVERNVVQPVGANDLSVLDVKGPADASIHTNASHC
jgi:hypothetical protein